MWQCAGRVQRMHEKLLGDERIQVKYSTLTRMVRELGLGQPPPGPLPAGA
jgi:hypothetical protein